jgi:hypothetical protein
MNDRPLCFFAYPDRPRNVSESIELAIQQINKVDVASARGWKSLRVAGRIVIEEVAEVMFPRDGGQ